MSRIGRKIIQWVMARKGYDMVYLPMYDIFFDGTTPKYAIGTYFIHDKSSDDVTIYSGLFSLLYHLLRNIDNV